MVDANRDTWTARIVSSAASMAETVEIVRPSTAPTGHYWAAYI